MNLFVGDTAFSIHLYLYAIMKPTLCFIALLFLVTSCKKRIDRNFTGSVYSAVDSTPLANMKYYVNHIYPKRNGYTSVGIQFTTDGLGNFSVMSQQKPTEYFRITDLSGTIVDSLNNRSFGEQGAVDFGRLYVR